MKNSNRFPLLTSAVVLGLLGLLGLHNVSNAGKPAPPPPPPVTYTLTYLDANLRLAKMNEAGVAVGYAAGDAPLAKVRLADGMLIDLTDHVQAEIPGSPWVLLDFALEINEGGQIAGRGWRMEDGVPQARLFRYSPAQEGNPACIEAVRTGQLGSTLFLKGMNDLGDIVLHASASGQDLLPATPRPGDSAWVFSGSPGSGTASLRLDAAVPQAINNYREVTGAKDTGSGSYAFLSASNGTYNLAGTINGNTTSKYDVSEGTTLNDAGVVAGWARLGKVKGSENTSQRSVRQRSDDTWEDLSGTSTGANSWAEAMNSSGVTVGKAGGVNGLGYVFISGKIYSLRDLMLNPPANLKYVNAKHISDSGVICGTLTLQNADGTTAETAMILTPVPAP